MSTELTHYQWQAQVLLPRYIIATRAVTSPMTGLQAWKIIQEVDAGNSFKGKAIRTNIYDKANSNFLYWARVYVRQTYGEQVHQELDDIFASMGYHRLKD